MTPLSPALKVDSVERGRIRAFLVDAALHARMLAEGHPALPADERALLQSAVRCSRFKAEMGETLLVALPDARALWWIGTGKKATMAALRRAAAVAAQQVPAELEWSLLVPSSGDDRARAIGALAEGVWLSSYQFRAGAPDKRREIAGACTLVVDAGDLGMARRAVERAGAVCCGIGLARDLTNAPAQDLGPAELADAARDLARRHGLLLHELRGDEIKQRGFRLIEAVGRAARRPPTYTVIEYRLEGRPAEIAWIGKGVVFDSGGLDLKASDSMALMRKDMAGAGSVLGALDSVARMGLAVPLLVAIPAAENCIGPDAFRPGDVLRSLDGLTVEVGNTDAEGRLLLADAIADCKERGVRRMVDLATLTGAARVALGPDVPAVFGNDDPLVARILEASEIEDEAMWRLPLVEAYESHIDSPFADVNNSSSDKRAGAISAALFLRRFVRDTPWAHIDFYGWEDRGKPGTPIGANGACVRTLVRLLECGVANF